MLCDIGKILALPPTQWPFDVWRGPPRPSMFQQLLMGRMRDGADLDGAPDALVHARAPTRPPPAPATTNTQRGAPPIHDWNTIERLDAEFCRTYFANHNRVPGWKEREDALKKKLGETNTPHVKSLQEHLPKIALLKIALLKERNSRSI